MGGRVSSGLRGPHLPCCPGPVIYSALGATELILTGKIMLPEGRSSRPRWPPGTLVLSSVPPACWRPSAPWLGVGPAWAGHRGHHAVRVLPTSLIWQKQCPQKGLWTQLACVEGGTTVAWLSQLPPGLPVSPGKASSWE